MIYVIDELTEEAFYINPDMINFIKVITPLEEYEVNLIGNNKINIRYEYFERIKKVLHK